MVAVAVLVIGALAASYAWEVWRNREVAAQTAQINQKLVVVRREVAEVLALEAKIDELRARERLLQSLEAREIPWAEMLTDLAGRTPHDAWLANASVGAAPSGLALSLAGSGLSYDAIARFMTALAGSQFYDDVDLQGAQRTKLGQSPVVQFGLSLKMRPLAVTPAPATPPPAKPAQEPSR